MKSLWKYYILFLTLINVVVWIAILNYPSKNLHMIACDVGQGDAILVVYAKTQILIDGGPDASVVDCLSKYLPFWDRQLEAVIMTHAEIDHYGGLIDVFERYKVQSFIKSPLDSGSQEYKVLKDLVGGKGIRVVEVRKGMKVRLGLMHLDILSPAKEEITVSTGTEFNKYSVVTILSYKNFSALLTGDIPPEISDELAGEFRNLNQQPVDYLKVPHHGSKNGLSKSLLDEVSPVVAVISVGKDNSYGHPHEETIKLLDDKDIKILRTDEIGDVEIVSDGKKVWLDN